MSEKILKALIKLFAIIGTADENSAHSRSVVESFLKQMLSKEQLNEFLTLYDEYVKQQNEGAEGEKKETPTCSKLC